MIKRRQEHFNDLERIRFSLVAISGESKEVLSRCPLIKREQKRPCLYGHCKAVLAWEGIMKWIPQNSVDWALIQQEKIKINKDSWMALQTLRPLLSFCNIIVIIIIQNNDKIITQWTKFNAWHVPFPKSLKRHWLLKLHYF